MSFLLHSMTARAVVVRGTQILLMHRRKDGREYFVLPGGHVEEGETVEETVVRELYEETGLHVRIQRELARLYNPFDESEHVYFHVEAEAGEPVLGGPEVDRQCTDNYYALVWHELAQLHEIPLQPKELRTLLTTISFTQA
jgi:8-oxo-dGTP diphosphatase